MNTHYGVVVFSGDPAGEHPDVELRHSPPSLTLIACGPQEFCWEALATWTETNPLRMWEEVEVLQRSDAIVEHERWRADAGA